MRYVQGARLQRGCSMDLFSTVLEPVKHYKMKLLSSILPMQKDRLEFFQQPWLLSQEIELIQTWAFLEDITNLWIYHLHYQLRGSWPQEIEN